jgi:hypothetical protein
MNSFDRGNSWIALYLCTLYLLLPTYLRLTKCGWKAFFFTLFKGAGFSSLSSSTQPHYPQCYKTWGQILYGRIQRRVCYVGTKHGHKIRTPAILCTRRVLLSRQIISVPHIKSEQTSRTLITSLDVTHDIKVGF